MKIKWIIVITILIIKISYENTNAQIITDRPDQTESSSTVPIGSLQLESGVLVEYQRQDQENSRQILLPTNLFRYGITNWIELRILNQFEINEISEEQSEGVSDLEVGTKIQILRKENIDTEIALLSHLLLPTNSNNFTNDNYGTINKLSISHTINENVGLGYNVGYNYFGSGNGDFTYSLALGIGINEKAGVYVEPFGELSNMEELVVNFNTGFTYLLNKNLQFDFSFGTGINQSMNYLSIGMSWLMERQ